MTLEQEIINFAYLHKRFSKKDLFEYLKFEDFASSSISTKLSELVKRDILIPFRARKNREYELNSENTNIEVIFSKKWSTDSLEEHIVVEYFRNKLLFNDKVSENVSAVYEYAFSEMVNNAIDHSQSGHIAVQSSIKGDVLSFVVNDFGIGVFHNIMSSKNIKNEFDAMQELQKGKVTTFPQAHSGEGIFFTSKIADYFQISSYGYIFEVNNRTNDITYDKVNRAMKGSSVSFEISLSSKKHLTDIFSQFSDPEEKTFDRTRIPLGPIHKVKVKSNQGTVLVSRSQAKRLLDGLEKFESIAFDFGDVPTIGQAFADEIFRVFQTKHPEKELIIENANNAVTMMISRAIRR